MLNVGTGFMILFMSAFLFGLSRWSSSMPREEWKQKSVSEDPEERVAAASEDYPQNLGVAAACVALFGVAVILVDLVRHLF